MRTIDLTTWSRRDHFKLFTTWATPHFNLCANVDVTAFRPAVKARDASFTVAMAYIITRAANSIPEFRTRIRMNLEDEHEVVEHAIIHSGITLLQDDDLFTFCTFDYDDDFATYCANAAGHIAYARAHPTTENEARDDLIYMSAIPWVAFTGCIHPVMSWGDSVPRFAWGKFFEEGDRSKMPLNLQVHHGLIDGIHAARFYEAVQVYLSDPAAVLGAA
jgi:chloramphenicol O-acetyltransferase type A